ncbi:hypothetical protein GV819_02960 [Pseudomonas sp. Fl5BN2]|uniref:hypothetical protein n=1 Tax=Pseudomonas sp. Fl5BN2 TaxID=2697652 RepID=UPI001376EBC2|nr:hypothetical protein [Pseudomonas sp. Fl5BN2]NBF01245.1 hypothetical protein [Pseudomonas sp. Fl5BN2]
MIDISNWPAVSDSVIGEAQTPESMKYFAQINASSMKEGTALVQTARAKGTPAAEILDKVLALNSQLPSRVKDTANIFY